MAAIAAIANSRERSWDVHQTETFALLDNFPDGKRG